MTNHIHRAIEIANDRDVGQFHVFGEELTTIDGRQVPIRAYYTSWRNLDVAISVASKLDNGVVYNSSHKKVWFMI